MTTSGQTDKQTDRQTDTRHRHTPQTHATETDKQGKLTPFEGKPQRKAKELDPTRHRLLWKDYMTDSRTNRLNTDFDSK